MTSDARQPPSIAPYIELIDSFVDGTMSASEFDRSFTRAMKSERRTLGSPAYAILQDLFEDADAYVERADLRTESGDLDDGQLLSCAVRSRELLRDAGF